MRHCELAAALMQGAAIDYFHATKGVQIIGPAMSEVVLARHNHAADLNYLATNQAETMRPDFIHGGGIDSAPIRDLVIANGCRLLRPRNGHPAIVVRVKGQGTREPQALVDAHNKSLVALSSLTGP